MFKSLTTVYLKRFYEYRFLSTAVNLQPREKIQSFRCLETDPSNHSVDHIGQFYTIPKEEANKIFWREGLPPVFRQQCDTFDETSLMIRKQTLDIINCMKNLDYTKPTCRFVLYGLYGTGKTLSLAHILHYAYKSGFLLVHVPWLRNWYRSPREVCTSIIHENLFDLNIDAGMWLSRFKHQNSHFLKREDFKVTKDCVWNKRETTPKDAPLVELIDFGINRIKYASLCINVLAEEIKTLSQQGVCKTLVALDGYNAFFHPNTKVYREKKQVVPPEQVSLTKPFLNLAYFDWHNAVVVLTVDEIAQGTVNDGLNNQTYMPRSLLGKVGFDHIDPFVPVQTTNYSEKEFVSCLEYYKDRRWIQQYYPGLEDELAFVSNKNPCKLMEVTAPL